MRPPQAVSPDHRLIVGVSTNSSAAAASNPAAIPPYSATSVPGWSATKKPERNPASLLPSEVAKNHRPIMTPANFAGDSFVTMLNPTGLRHSSPTTSKKYTPTSHRGLTLPSAVSAEAGTSRQNASP